MENLDRFIKELNLVFTNTIDRIEFCKVGFDINTQNVNYENTINIYKLVSSFNKLYLSFKKEYDSLEKIELGKDLSIINFNTFKLDKDNYRDLIIYIDEPIICNHSYTLLYIFETNNNIYSFVTNNENSFDKNFYKENITLDIDKCKIILDCEGIKTNEELINKLHKNIHMR